MVVILRMNRAFKLHWSTCASTRRTMSPASRSPSSLIRSRSRLELVDNRANLVGRFTNQFSRTQFANRRFTAGSPDSVRSFTVHGSRRVLREESVHGSRFTDSG